MASKKILVIVVLLSVILGVDARSPRKTEKLYRKAGKWQRKLRDVWALLGVKPFLVQPGEEGDECVLKSKVEEDYVLKSTVEADACGTGTVLDATTMKCTVSADYMSNDAVAANYVLKTCGFPPTGWNFKAGMDEDCTVDPTGQTDCATKCFEEIMLLNLGESCSEDVECASGSCRESCRESFAHPAHFCCSPDFG